MRNHVRGLSLAELLVTVAVMTVALTVALPVFGGLQERTRLAAALHQLTGSLAVARSHAVTGGRPVTVCPSGDGTTCRGDLAWEDGWILFADPQRRGLPASSADVLQHVGPLPGTIRVRSTPGRTRVRYLAGGRAHGSNLTLRLCSTDGRLLGSVVVNNSGRARVQRSRGSVACPWNVEKRA